jgi:hypothetical protein
MRADTSKTIDDAFSQKIPGLYDSFEKMTDLLHTNFD